MPLSAPKGRRPVHTRTVVCRGFQRDDGLWDVEGRLTDVRSHALTLGERGLLPPGEPMHDLSIRVAIDDSFLIHEVETATDGSPYPACGAVAPNFQRLVGLRIGEGWRRAVAERVGGVQGCTHLAELLGPLATTAFQLVYLAKLNEGGEAAVAGVGRPPLLDACHMLASDGAVARDLWPDYYTGKR